MFSRLAQSALALATAFTVLTPALAQGAVGGALSLIYRASGVRGTSGAPQTGTATSIHCTNTSTVNENLVIVVRNIDGTIISNSTFSVAPFWTFTASTHDTAVFVEGALLSPGVGINQGVVSIASTTLNMHCTAMILDAASATPVGIALHMVRFNPAPGTME